MAVLKRQIIINSMDTNNQEITTTISNINPAITDVTILRNAAQQLNSLTDNTLRSIYIVNTEDITEG